MKFSYKILLSCIITMAAALGIGGYFFVNNVFETSMEREMEQAADELGAELRFLTLGAANDGAEQEALLLREIEDGAAALVVVREVI